MPVNRRARVVTKSIPPPVGGLNTRDAVANMAPTDALILDNYDPGTTDMPLRKGFVTWGSGIAGAIETLAAYNSPGLQQMFAVAGGNLYDVTANAPVGAPLVTGLSNSRWQWINFANAGVHFLVMVNGIDSPMVYNGTAWSRIGNGSGKTIVSITPSYAATVKTKTAHGLTTGTSIVLSGVSPSGFNGTYAITVVDATSFTIPLTSDPGSNASTVGSYTVAGTAGAVIASISTIYYGNLTTAEPHGLSTGAVVGVANTDPTEYSGTFTITVTGASSFRYTLSSAPDGDAAADIVGIYGTSVNGAIWGVDPATFVHVNVFGSRLWFTQINSFITYYLDLYAVAGQAYPFDVGAQFGRGGYMMGLATWNIDNTAGLQEYLCFCSSEGEVVVYQGSDPTQATTFSKSAVFLIGPPVGRRFYEKLGSDIVFLGSDGLVPLSKALLTDRSQEALAVSAKIQPSINIDIETYGNNFGWQPILFPDGNKVLVNVPLTEDGTSRQYAMSTITSAWARVTGWNAICFCYFKKNLYFGAPGLVGQAYMGNDDGGVAINSDIQPAYSYFDQRGVNKSFKMMRPIFLTTDGFAPQIDLNVDFSTQLPGSTPTLSFGSSTPWNTTPWNAVPWGGSQKVVGNWLSIFGEGYAAAPRMRAQTRGIAFSLESFDLMFEPQMTPTF
ncbi:hypothetical protein WM40_22685 [Robbsia andropogonis]|uniref:Ubiquitin-activating enzyme E1 FCCH domain-containing protein n=1 Tax=Robbsia andropogonis TaxID=28092 RepID=A0A0F5JVA3_9BURK|nr:hypothetical protein [Robbsia andropogonis]KKB61549.1 hypothetical protein WM40_22685 [Robbsia andropogonis]